jgi:hypothetical protein
MSGPLLFLFESNHSLGADRNVFSFKCCGEISTSEDSIRPAVGALTSTFCSSKRQFVIGYPRSHVLGEDTQRTLSNRLTIQQMTETTTEGRMTWLFWSSSIAVHISHSQSTSRGDSTRSNRSNSVRFTEGCSSDSERESPSDIGYHREL